MTIVAGAIRAYGSARPAITERVSEPKGEASIRDRGAVAALISPAARIEALPLCECCWLAGSVQYLSDLVTGGLGRVIDAGLAREDRHQHVLKDVGRLDVGPVWRVRREPAVLGRGGEDRRQARAQADQRGRVRDDAPDGDHLALELVAAEQLDPLPGEVLVLALGRDAQVRSAEEDGCGVTRVVARDRECAEVGLKRGVAALRVGDDSDFPAVGDDHRDVTLRERLVLLGLVAGLVRARELADDSVQGREALLRVGAVECTGPRLAGLGGDVTAEVPDERRRRVPVLAGEVERGEVRV